MLPTSLISHLLGLNYLSIRPTGIPVPAPDEAQQIITSVADYPDQVRLEEIPRSSFLQETIADNLSTAARNIPSHLTLVGSPYRVLYEEEPSTTIMLTIPALAGTESHHILDLYTWNGEAWTWQTSHSNPAENLIETELNFLPELVAVMQSYALNPKISTDYIDDMASFEIKNNITEVAGLALDANGQLMDDLGEMSSKIQAADLDLVPTIRNWDDECHPIYADSVDTLLTHSETRERHIRTVVENVRAQGFQGIEIDYRDLNPDLGQAYITYLEELRQALPNDKRLYVQLELPRQTSSGVWDTGGYDWPAIGRLVDLVKLPVLSKPDDFAPGGRMEIMLDWAVGQINRYKLQLLFSARSIEWIDGESCGLSYQQALERLGDVTLTNSLDIIEPGQDLNFTLAGLPSSSGIQVDKTNNIYWFSYLDQGNRRHTVYLENTANLIDILQLTARYNLQGLAIQGLAPHRNRAQIWAIIQNFLNQTDPPPIENRYTIVWQIQEDGRQIAREIVDLSKPNYLWTAPTQGGSFEIAASITSSQNPTPVSQGYLVVEVATPTSAPSSIPTPSPTHP